MSAQTDISGNGNQPDEVSTFCACDARQPLDFTREIKWSQTKEKKQKIKII